MLEWKRNRRDEGERLIWWSAIREPRHRHPVVAKRDELRMPQVVAVGPFRLFDLRG